MTARVLVVDDEPGIRDTMRMILEYEGHDVQTAASGPEAIAAVERAAPDVVFLDIKMPGLDGLEVLSRLRAFNETLPVVMVSAHGTAMTALEAGRLGAFRFVEKPLSKDVLLDAVREGAELGALRRENRQMKSALETRHEMVGESAALKAILSQVRRAAPTSATVLILGESGVGKELVARAVHRSSLRARERFVQVNCAAIPEELIESELFGHERGAFTGATEKQIGKFEMADRGTIFLDEVGDMSAKTQAKVLRVLQEGEVERLGSSRTAKVDTRVIAATNKDLEEEIAEGRFREDLYFRLSVVPISVPPLRERRDDIPGLVQHFAAEFGRENNRRPARFSPSAMDALRQARWRGNIRELRNAVERLLIMSERELIDAEDVRAVVRVERSGPASPGAAAVGESPAPAPDAPGTLREFKEWSERAFLLQKLREAGWNISKTAELIDTPRSNLYKKLEQYGIKHEPDA
jgi:two-component system nitrogen regulation response regulator NtrX